MSEQAQTAEQNNHKNSLYRPSFSSGVWAVYQLGGADPFAHFENKWGRPATHCMVALDNKYNAPDNIVVIKNQGVNSGNIWIC